MMDWAKMFHRCATWRVIIPLLLICGVYNWAFNYSTLAFSNRTLIASGCGEGLLDLRLHYSATEAWRAIDCYGDSGRAVYRRFLIVDTSYLLVYAVTYALLLTRLLKSIIVPASPWRRANLLPLCVAIADSLENATIHTMLTMYPRTAPWLGVLAGYATSLKFALTAATLAALVVCMVALIARRLRRTPASGKSRYGDRV